jgi:aliphatic sulfonates family ABC transporter substrate-binding protein
MEKNVNYSNISCRKNETKKKRRKRMMKKRIKKPLLALLLVLTMGVSLIGCGTSDSQKDTSGSSDKKENTVIRLAVQKSIYLPYLAESLGYFEEEFADDGITVELDEFALGPAVVEAIGSNQVDIGFLGDLPAFAGLVNGGEYKIIGKYYRSTSAGLIVRNDANIKKLEDLKGKKIAVSMGSNLQPLAELYLEAAGLTDKDVELVNLSLTDITTSIVKGEVDAAVTDQPYIAQAEKSGEVTQLLDAEGYKTFVAPIIVENSFGTENADLTARVLKALQKAADWKEDNLEEAIKRSAEATGFDEEDLKNVLPVADMNVCLTDDDIQALKDGQDQIYNSDLIKKKLNLDDYIDTSFLEKAGIQ